MMNSLRRSLIVREDATSLVLEVASSSRWLSITSWQDRFATGPTRVSTLHTSPAYASVPIHGGDMRENKTMLGRRWYSSKVPEYWGKDSPYHPGTEFLGTPHNHLDLVKKRPLSPHVFDDVGVGLSMPPKFHYKMPLGAVSSVTNRATGVMLSLGAGAAGWAALVSGDLGTAIASFKSSYPLLVIPAKFAVAFPLVYHYLGGLRHLYWDHYRFGNQSERDSPLEYGKMEQSSKALLVTGSLGAAMLALYSL